MLPKFEDWFRAKGIPFQNFGKGNTKQHQWRLSFDFLSHAVAQEFAAAKAFTFNHIEFRAARSNYAAPIWGTDIVVAGCRELSSFERCMNGYISARYGRDAIANSHMILNSDAYAIGVPPYISLSQPMLLYFYNLRGCLQNPAYLQTASTSSSPSEIRSLQAQLDELRRQGINTVRSLNAIIAEHAKMIDEVRQSNRDLATALSYMSLVNSATAELSSTQSDLKTMEGKHDTLELMALVISDEAIRHDFRERICRTDTAIAEQRQTLITARHELKMLRTHATTFLPGSQLAPPPAPQPPSAYTADTDSERYQLRQRTQESDASASLPSKRPLSEMQTLHDDQAVLHALDGDEDMADASSANGTPATSHAQISQSEIVRSASRGSSAPPTSLLTPAPSNPHFHVTTQGDNIIVGGGSSFFVCYALLFLACYALLSQCSLIFLSTSVHVPFQYVMQTLSFQLPLVEAYHRNVMKTDAFSSLLTAHKPHAWVISEMKSHQPVSSRLHVRSYNIFESTGVKINTRSSKWGVIVGIHRNFPVQQVNILDKLQGRALIVDIIIPTVAGRGFPHRIIGLYAPYDPGDHDPYIATFWDHITNICHSAKYSWSLIGDLNVTLTSMESTGRDALNNSACASYRGFLCNTSAIDLWSHQGDADARSMFTFRNHYGQLIIDQCAYSSIGITIGSVSVPNFFVPATDHKLISVSLIINPPPNIPSTVHLSTAITPPVYSPHFRYPKPPGPYTPSRKITNPTIRLITTIACMYCRHNVAGYTATFAPSLLSPKLISPFHPCMLTIAHYSSLCLETLGVLCAKSVIAKSVLSLSAALVSQPNHASMLVSSADLQNHFMRVLVTPLARPSHYRFPTNP
ncbi:hypothetical protein EW146_g7552 [Bondarzewia mesenterica]|uniref:Endonuclease/exonuclease/phosphatase domain-containing protein n=1 Tax=Bondarzewia mesenterica TaxID=1095465 RepID=A0A4S4LKH0_9AGAM|nr:hypothetical protein EW146_g7552 [Bondarzewia mesenterica]